jgi:general stress protein YciG
MAGNLQGGVRAALTNKERYDNVSPYKEYGGYYQYIGAIGGRKGTTGGFAANRELAREAGRKGGKISKRGKK